MPERPTHPAGEADPSTQEISAVHARSYALGAMPRPTGAAAAPTPPAIPLAPATRMQAKFNPLADGMLYLVVFIGGVLGTAMRYGTSLLMPGPAARTGVLASFHMATFAANMLACFIFAWLTSYVSQASWLAKRTRQLTSRGVGMGVCGGFSTLSAFAIEELRSLQDGRIGGFALYMAASFAGGLLVAAVGAKLGLRMSAKAEAKVVRAAMAGAGGRHAPPANPAPIPVGGPVSAGGLASVGGLTSDGSSALDGSSASAGGSSASLGGLASASGPASDGGSASGSVDVAAGQAPQGDYGQPLSAQLPAQSAQPARSRTASPAQATPAQVLSSQVSPSQVPPVQIPPAHSQTETPLAGSSQTHPSPMPVAIEPDPITDEIPLVADPVAGDATPSEPKRGPRP